ncbi:MAG: hypothetical protein C4315_04080 [Chloroflexota bacterium]
MTVRGLKPETVAWVVLWTAFGVFLLLCTGTILAVRWFIQSATVTEEAQLTVTGGTVAIRPLSQGSPDWVVAPPQATLEESDQVRTDEGSTAFIRLPDGSTVSVLPGTELAISRLRRFRFGEPGHLLDITIKSGRLILGVAHPIGRPTAFRILSGGAEVQLAEGNYAVRKEADRLEVRVRQLGSALVRSGPFEVNLGSLQRAVAYPGRLEGPLPPEDDLIRAGDFTQGLDDRAWQPVVEEACWAAPQVQNRLEPTRVDGEQAVRFFRQGSEGTPCQMFLHQEVNRDISDLISLRLKIEFRIDRQTLSGGGYLGSEYPVQVRMLYRGADGGERVWVRGFYIQNVEGRRTDHGVKVEGDRWVEYWVPDAEDPNLLTLAGGVRYIRWIEVMASGHDFESYVRRVSLLGQ